MSAINIRKRTTLSNDRYPLEQITFDKQNRRGETEAQDREVYFRPDAIAVLLVDQRQWAFLLIRQFRLPVYLHEVGDGYLLEACAGVMDEGELPEETVAREVLEETGYEVENLQKAGLVYVSPAFCMERIHLFIADIDLQRKKEQGGGLEEEGEEIEPAVITYEKAKEMLLSGEIHDVKTMTLLQRFFMLHPNV